MNLEQKRVFLQELNHQREQIVKIFEEQFNNLIDLSESSFPQVIKLFSDDPRDNLKWINFYHEFWHIECITDKSFEDFNEHYKNFCFLNNYPYSENEARQIYDDCQKSIAYSLFKDDFTKFIIQSAAKQVLNSIKDIKEFERDLVYLAKEMPEFELVNSFEGVDELLASQIIAEIGDVSRFKSRKALINYAGINPGSKQENQRRRGNYWLRKALFEVMKNLVEEKPDDPIYYYIEKKRSEGKSYRVYMYSGINKFLRIYYKRIGDFLSSLGNSESGERVNP